MSELGKASREYLRLDDLWRKDKALADAAHRRMTTYSAKRARAWNAMEAARKEQGLPALPPDEATDREVARLRAFKW